MAAVTIHNLVRALTRPYVGAHCRSKQGDVKIWKSRIVELPSGAADAEPGRVLAASNGHVTVRCGLGALEVVEHEFDRLPEVATYLP